MTNKKVINSARNIYTSKRLIFPILRKLLSIYSHLFWSVTFIHMFVELKAIFCLIRLIRKVLV